MILSEVAKKIGGGSASNDGGTSKTQFFNFIHEMFNENMQTNRSILFMKLDAVELRNTDKYASYLSDAAAKLSSLDSGVIKINTTNTEMAKHLITGVYESGKELVDTATEVGKLLVDGKAVEAALKSAEAVLAEYMESISSLNAEAENGAQAEDKNIRATWWLPLPNELKTAINHSYIENELNPLDKVLKSRSFAIAGALGGQLEKAGESMGNSGLAGKVAGKVVKGSGKTISTEKIQKSIEIAANVAKRHNVTFDNNVVNTYAGTGTRKFSFSYTIMPQSKQHANDIMMAIVNLKKFIAGSRNNEIVKQSNVFKIKFLESSGSDSAKPAEFIEEVMFTSEVEFNVTDINITYGADGSMMLFNDGMPKSLNLKISLEERKPLYRIEDKEQ